MVPGRKLRHGPPREAWRDGWSSRVISSWASRDAALRRLSNRGWGAGVIRCGCGGSRAAQSMYWHMVDGRAPKTKLVDGAARAPRMAAVDGRGDSCSDAEVTARLQELVRPHVESFDWFVQYGL